MHYRFTLSIYLGVPKYFTSLGNLIEHKVLFAPPISSLPSCTRYFPKSRFNATFQMVINGTNPGLWSVSHIEALWRRNILPRCFRFSIQRGISFCDDFNLASQTWCWAGVRTGEEDSPTFCGRFFLASYFPFCIFNPSRGKFLSFLTGPYLTPV